MLIGIVVQVGRRVFLVVCLDLDGALRVVIVPHLPAGGVLRVDRRAARHRGAAMARSAGAVNRRDAVARRTEQARGLIDGGDGVARIPCDVGDIAGLRGDGAVVEYVCVAPLPGPPRRPKRRTEPWPWTGPAQERTGPTAPPIGARDADTGHVARIGLPGHLDVDRVQARGAPPRVFAVAVAVTATMPSPTAVRIPPGEMVAMEGSDTDQLT